MKFSKVTFFESTGPEITKRTCLAHYDRIPDGTQFINLIHETYRKKTRNIDLRIEDFPEGFPKVLAGKWYATDDDANLTFCFLPEKVLYDGEIWDYGEIEKGWLNTKISLKGNERNINLSVNTKGKDSVSIGVNGESTSKYKRYHFPKVNTEDPYEVNILPKADTAVYAGYIKGYRPDLGPKSGMVHLNDFLGGHSLPYRYKVKEDGSFRVKLAIHHPISAIVRMGQGTRYYSHVFLEPGKTTFQLFEKERQEFMGPTARVNKEIQLYKEVTKPFGSINYHRDFSKKEIINYTAEEYKQYCYGQWEKALKIFKKYAFSEKVSPKGKQILSAGINFNALYCMLEVESFKRDVLSEFREFDKSKYPDLKPGNDYYDFLTTDILNDLDGLLSVNSAYSIFINRLSFCHWTKSKVNSMSHDFANALRTLEKVEKTGRLSPIEAELLQYDRDKGAPFREYEAFRRKNRKEIIDFMMRHEKHVNKFWEIDTGTNAGVVSEALLLDFVNQRIKNKSKADRELLRQLSPELIERDKDFTDRFGPTITKIYDKHSVESNLLFKEIVKLNTLDSLRDHHYNGEATFAFDLIKLNNLLSVKYINTIGKGDKRIDLLKEHLNVPVFREYLEMFIAEQYKYHLQREKSVAKKKAVHDADTILAEMIRPLEGKVVLVDFWNTWCGPCLDMHQKLKPLKKDMEGKDVEFLYIADVSSPLKSWRTFADGMKGKHHRVSKEEWQALKAKFEISGIPHLALIGKDGRIINPKIDWIHTVKTWKGFKAMIDKELANEPL
ncbi:TlpA family protein disulfide reductase [Fulvitalea axinellae]